MIERVKKRGVQQRSTPNMKKLPFHTLPQVSHQFIVTYYQYIIKNDQYITNGQYITHGQYTALTNNQYIQMTSVLPLISI